MLRRLTKFKSMVGLCRCSTPLGADLGGVGFRAGVLAIDVFGGRAETGVQADVSSVSHMALRWTSADVGGGSKQTKNVWARDEWVVPSRRK